MRYSEGRLSPALALCFSAAMLLAAASLLDTATLPALGSFDLGYGPVAVAVILAAVGAIPVVALLLASPGRRGY